MASFIALRQALAANLATIAGLTAYDTNPAAIETPAAVVGGFRRILFGVGMGGTSRWEIPIRVFVGDATEPAAQDELDAFMDTLIDDGIVPAIESDRTLGGAARGLKVTEASRYGIVTVGDQSFLAFEVLVEVLA